MLVVVVADAAVLMGLALMELTAQLRNRLAGAVLAIIV